MLAWQSENVCGKKKLQDGIISMLPFMENYSVFLEMCI